MAESIGLWEGRGELQPGKGVPAGREKRAKAPGKGLFFQPGNAHMQHQAVAAVWLCACDTPTDEQTGVLMAVLAVCGGCRRQ